MVNIGILIAGALIFAFFASGGIKRASAFLGSDFSGEQQKSESGEVTTSSLEMNPTIPIPQGSQDTVATIQASQILRTDISQKRKFSTVNIPIKINFFNTKEGGSEPQAGTIVSAVTRPVRGFGQPKDLDRVRFGFDSSKLTSLVTRPFFDRPTLFIDPAPERPAGTIQPLTTTNFTAQEQEDIANLTQRFREKRLGAQKVSLSPEEIILEKRNQENIAMQLLGGSNFVFSGGVTTAGGNFIEKKGGLFGKATFALGGKTPEQFAQQQADKQAIRLKLEQNRLLQIQRQKTGQTILSTIAKSGLNQKQFLKGVGINLTGKLSPIALARLREKGFKI